MENHFYFYILHLYLHFADNFPWGKVRSDLKSLKNEKKPQNNKNYEFKVSLLAYRLIFVSKNDNIRKSENTNICRKG